VEHISFEQVIYHTHTAYLIDDEGKRSYP
ncbi:uncharacterized protein METZ01_LOCUS289847, partial [marine metagenome]